MSKFRSIEFYTLDDIDFSIYSEDVKKNQITNTGLINILSSLELLSVGETPNDIYNFSFYNEPSLAREMFNRILIRYRYHYCYSVKDNQVKETKEKEFITKLIFLLDHTYLRYSLIYNAYKTKKDDLLKSLKSKDTQNSSSSQGESHNNGTTGNTLTKINDTPQSSPTTGFDGDDYVSELTKANESHTDIGQSSINSQGLVSTEHEVEPSTLMNRINEIQIYMKNLILEWLNEFDGLFIEEGNV